MPPRRSSRSTRASADPAPAVAPTSSGSKRKRGQSAALNETDNEKENVSKLGIKPSSSSSRTRRPSSRASSVGAPSRASRSTRASARGNLREVEEEEGDEEHRGEEEQVTEDSEVPRVRKKSRNSTEGEEEEEVVRSKADEAPTSRPPNSLLATPAKTPSHSASRDSDSDDLDGFDENFKGSPMRPRRQDAKSNPPSQSTKRAAAAVADEEEKSLLESREPKPKPQSQIQMSPTEQPSGPRSGLVIHKMVLINFKSYAGPSTSHFLRL